MTLVKVIVVGPTAIMRFAMVLVIAIVIFMAAAILRGQVNGNDIMENTKKLQYHSVNFRTERVNTLNCTLCISKLICAANVFLFFDQIF